MLGDDNSGIDVSLPKVDEVSSINNTADSGQDDKMTSPHEASSSLAIVNGSTTSRATGVANWKREENESMKDGHYYLQVAEETARELKACVDELERDLKENDFSDEGLPHYSS